MPKHSYVCDCGKTYERSYGFSDTKPNKIKCECGKNARSKIGGFAIRYTAQPK